VFQKAEDDAIFFMAGAISFNVLMAFVPLVVFTAGLSGLILSANVSDPAGALVTFVQDALPEIRGDVALTEQVRERVTALLDRREGFTAVGAVLLVWFSTRLAGTLRTALREVFDIGEGRDIVRGKLYDMQVVVAGGILFTVNLGVTAFLRTIQEFGYDALGFGPGTVTFLQTLSAQILAFLSIWVLFLGIYRYLPARRIPWRTALVAATFTALLHELLKEGFGWYVTEVANYRSTYGNLLTVAILFFWIYYEAIGFILGGEVAQVWTMRRARRVQRAAGRRAAGDAPS
jgi:membrane protein